MREPSENSKLKLENKLKVLWRPELFELQKKYEMPKYKDKSKDFVIEKIAERFSDPESRQQLNADISSILFERDYTCVEETLKEYRKGEMQKVIDAETDTKKKLEYMVAQAEMRSNFPGPKKRKKRRRK